jgi:chromatin remodeling complex protein RSC6
MSKVTTSTKATPKTTTKKTTKAKEVLVEPTPVVETTPVETTPVPVETTTAPLDATTTVAEVELTDSMKQRFEALIKSKQNLMNDLKREIQELRKMQRDHEHAVKEASKRSKKKKSNSDSTPRKPSGFASPVIVSDDLYSFLAQFGVKKTDPIARTDVTRHITSYIKEKDLQNPEHRREIVPDAALKKLFGPAIEPKDPNDANSPLVYTYLKLQRYLSPHFPKKATA